MVLAHPPAEVFDNLNTAPHPLPKHVQDQVAHGCCSVGAREVVNRLISAGGLAHARKGNGGYCHCQYGGDAVQEFPREPLFRFHGHVSLRHTCRGNWYWYWRSQNAGYAKSGARGEKRIMVNAEERVKIKLIATSSKMGFRQSRQPTRSVISIVSWFYSAPLSTIPIGN